MMSTTLKAQIEELKRQRKYLQEIDDHSGVKAITDTITRLEDELSSDPSSHQLSSWSDAIE